MAADQLPLNSRAVLWEAGLVVSRVKLANQAAVQLVPVECGCISR